MSKSFNLVSLDTMITEGKKCIFCAEVDQLGILFIYLFIFIVFPQLGHGGETVSLAHRGGTCVYYPQSKGKLLWKED